MKLLSSTVPTISIFLLTTTAQLSTPHTTPVTSINPSFTTTANLSIFNLSTRGPQKPGPKEPKEPEKCETGQECFWNHHCVDGTCQVGCSDLKDCKPPQHCYKGTCHWSPHFGRMRKCQKNTQKCIMNHHCCYHRCVFTKKVFGYCFAVDRGENPAPGDEWGDLRPDEFGMSDDVSKVSDLEGRDVDSEDSDDFDVDLEDLGLRLNDFALHLKTDGAESAALDEGMDYSAVEKGKGPFWGKL